MNLHSQYIRIKAKSKSSKEFEGSFYLSRIENKVWIQLNIPPIDVTYPESISFVHKGSNEILLDDIMKIINERQENFIASVDERDVCDLLIMKDRNRKPE